MTDPRIEKLAENLIDYSLRVRPGEKVLIELFECDSAIAVALAQKVFAVGGYPFVQLYDNKVRRACLTRGDDAYFKALAAYDLVRMNDIDCYIGVRGSRNSFELSDVPPSQTEKYSLLYSKPVHDEVRVRQKRWVVLRYPNDAMAQLAGMSTEAFEDYYFNVCNLDYGKMDRAMDALKALMERTDKVRLIARDTDLRFSIKGMPAIKCAGGCNIPDGEVYTAPIRNSVNGTIHYNAPSIENGIKFEDVRLEFKNGKIVRATANRTDECNAIFDTDEGARYVGEFAIGVNPYVTRPMGDILFDEKISGSIHFTPGASYDDAFNGNTSAVHWDLVLLMTPEYGGGEIWFDDVLVRKDGLFVLDELLPLNPDQLK